MTNIENDIVTFKRDDELIEIASKTILWAAGVQGSAMGKVLAENTGVECDLSGRVIVEPDLTIKGYKNIFLLGDLGNFSHQNGKQKRCLRRAMPTQEPRLSETDEERKNFYRFRVAGAAHDLFIVQVCAKISLFCHSPKTFAISEI